MPRGNLGEVDGGSDGRPEVGPRRAAGVRLRGGGGDGAGRQGGGLQCRLFNWGDEASSASKILGSIVTTPAFRFSRVPTAGN